MTTTHDDVLETLRRADPHPADTVAGASDDPRAQTMLAEILDQPIQGVHTAHVRGRRVPIGWRVVAPVLSLIVVVAVVAIVLQTRSGRDSSSTGGAAEIVLRLQPTPEVPHVTGAAVAQELQILRARLRLLGAAPGVRLIRRGDQIVVRSAGTLTPSPAALALLTRSPQVAFTDWEANVIAPDGRPVAPLLLAQNPHALLISQGGDHTGLAGGPDSGAVTLYAAVRLASHQSGRADAATLTRFGAESFAFAPAGSPRCKPSSGPCWVSGPSRSAPAATGAARRAGVAHPIVLTIPQGTVVVRAAEPGRALKPDYRDPRSRYYVMHDSAALTGLALRRIASSTDSAGQPDITAGLTSAGERAFQAVTATVAHRGNNLRLGNDSNFQHFAVIINGALATVPIINYNQYPDGVIASSGIEIDGGFSRAQARQLAGTLRLQTLPLRITIARGG